MKADSLSYDKLTEQFYELRDERSEWEAEWRQISEYLLPGRGVYQTYSKPRKRKLTSPRVINPIAEDALYVLTSGMHGGLTSPSRPWFDLNWSEYDLNDIEPLKAWLQDCTSRLHTQLQASNFYSVINSFYIEYAGFGTASMYVGEDTFDDALAFRFELLTAGEYVFATGADGKPYIYQRTIFMSCTQMVEKFGDQVSKEVRKRVKNNEAGITEKNQTVLETVIKKKYGDKPFTRVYYEMTGETKGNKHNVNSGEKPLGVAGFYEFPYPLARWGTIGGDEYGIGPGSRALPDIKRLQEQEKATLMASHKAINPPLNAPARMKGKLNTLPGGYNYYSNPNEQVKEIYQIRFDYQGVGVGIERVEQRIQRNFFNDIFLTAARDPNASPLKATQVTVQEQEKMLRLGPVIERLQHEFFKPVIERCFNIMQRKEMFMPLPPEYQELAGDYAITLVSPLATAQRMTALAGINSFLGFVGQAAQFDQGVMDNIDTDEAVREYADITGVKIGILRPQEQVQAMRQERAQAMAAQQAQEEQAMQQQHEASVSAEQATAQKTQAEAGVALIEGQEMVNDMGVM